MRFTHSQIKELIELEGKVSIALLSYVTHKMSKKKVETGQFVFDRSYMLLQMELWLRKH